PSVPVTSEIRPRGRFHGRSRGLVARLCLVPRAAPSLRGAGQPRRSPVTRAHLALLAFLVAAAPAGAAAPPAPPLRLDLLRFEVTSHGQTALRLRLDRQPDGSYLAEYGGEGMASRTGVRVPEGTLDELRQALADMDGFPT